MSEPSWRRICLHCGSMFRGDVGHCSRDGSAITLSTEDPLVDRVLKRGRYRVKALVGEGSAGRVYVAEDLQTDAVCAVKVLYGELAAMPDVIKRFRLEASAAGRLRHPNVVSVIDAGFNDPAEPLYLVMDYVPGPTVRERVNDYGPLRGPEARSFLRGVTEGLVHAHEKGVLHRDLKPDNIIVGIPDDRPRLVDFGVSKLLLVDAHPPLTSYGRVVGTPGFIAPEVLRGLVPDVRCDLYGLGVTAYFALTGRQPFSDVSTSRISETLSGIRLNFEEANVPGDLQAWVGHLVRHDPAERPPEAVTALELLMRAPQLSTWGASSAPAAEGAVVTPRAIQAPEAGVIDVRGSTGTAVDPSTEDEAPDPAEANFWEGEAPSVDEAAITEGASPLRWALLAVPVIVGAGLWMWSAAAVRPAAVAPAPPAVASGGADSTEPQRPIDPPTLMPIVTGTRPSEDAAPSASPEAEGVALEAQTGPAIHAKAIPPAPTPSAPIGPAKLDRKARRKQKTVATERGLVAAISADQLAKTYSSVGQKLELIDSDGAASLRRRYLDLPFADALRRPSRRPAIYRRLRAIEADLDRMLKESRP